MEKKLLESWKLKIGILTAILVPAVAITGAFYGIKEQGLAQASAFQQRISDVELKTEINKADKNTLNEVQRDVRAIRDDIVEIKTLLKHR